MSRSFIGDLDSQVIKKLQGEAIRKGKTAGTVQAKSGNVYIYVIDSEYGMFSIYVQHSDDIWYRSRGALGDIIDRAVLWILSAEDMMSKMGPDQEGQNE
jgi:hypothetical protein